MNERFSPDTLVAALEGIPRRPGRGFRFFGTDRQERFFLYEELHQVALRRAAFLQARGLEKGDRIALVIPENHEFVLSFLGAAAAGLVPVPIFPRATFKAAGGYVDTVAHIVSSSGARVVLTMRSMEPLVGQIRERGADIDALLLTETAFEGEVPPFARPTIGPDDLCFLQYTSGSTNAPKGVMVTHRNLVANARDFLGPNGLDRNDDDVGVSWLPLYHDMGLIGFILGTLICDIPVVILPTATFARTPRIWLETIHAYRGTITYAPNFAYQLVVKRLKDQDIAALDLSCLRVAGCGAEPIRAKCLLDFSERLRAAGFDGDRALLPSYGMAEATLAITFHDLGTPIVVDRVGPDSMRRGLAEPATDSAEGALELVGCGRAFPGHEVAVVDGDGKPLGDRQVGEVVVRGPSITSGYFENDVATRESYRDGWLHTGDLGYRAGDQLFICGRIKDLIIINGANHHPQDLEWAVDELEGVRRGNVVAFSVLRDGVEQLVIAAEGNSGDAAGLRKAIAQRITQEFGLTPAHVAITPVGSLPKTSSGKAQRRKTKEMYEARELTEHPLEP